ncbi:MAG: leucine-rich repeat protein [Ruminococcus sp.]|nr:leucine-rich repeat protein [Ruminococcus sp.]
MTKRLLSLLLTLLLVATVLPMNAVTAGAATLTDGDYTYELRGDGTAEIKKYNGTDTQIIVPTELGDTAVSSIGAYVYENNKTIESVTIPDGIKSISDRAFKNCSALSGCEIGADVSYIGPNAFENCTALTSVDIPSNVKIIDQYAFVGCTALTEITLHEGLESLGYDFLYGTAVSSVYIPSTLTSANTAFYGAAALEDVTFGEGFSSILYGMFKASSLKTLTIPDSVTKIDRAAFADMPELESLVIPDSVTEIALDLASNCPKLTSFSFGTGVNYVPACAFSRCTGLKEINIPANITEIRYDAFAYCTGLTEVEIPSNVKKLESFAFGGCTNLSGVTLNEGLTEIGEGAFESTAITEVTIPSTITNGRSPFLRCSNLKTINLPDGITTIFHGLYEGTGVESVTIPEGVTLLKDSAFRNCSELTEVILPSTLETIEQGAFVNCTALTSIDIPESVKTIGSWSFSGTTALTECTLHEGVETMGIAVFENSALTSIYVPASLKRTQWPFDRSNISEFTLGEGITELPGEIFKGCTLITEFNIPSSVTKIGDYAFSGCTALEKITIPDSVKEIGNGAFEGTTSLKNITLPEGLEVLGSQVFRYNSGVTSIRFPASLTRTNSPLDDSNISTVTFAEGITALPADMFHGADFVTKVKIPSTVTEIGNDCFRRSGLESVTIPDSVKTIGKNAFYDCFNLYAVKIGSGVDYLPSYCFANCTLLQNVVIPETVSDMADGVFYHTGLTFVRLPQSLSYIPMHIFENCADLTEVECSDEITAVGDNAFYNCTSLTTLRSSAEDVDFSNTSFGNCPKFYDKRFDVFNRAKTGIESTGSIGINETLIHFTLRYDIRDDWADEDIVMNKLYLNLPDNIEIVPASFSADGFDFDADTYHGDYKSFDMTDGRTSGVMRFSAYLKGANDSLKELSASVDFRYKGKYFNKPLGEVELTTSKLSLFASNKVTDTTTVVSGYSAFSDKKVNIHITHLNSDGTKGDSVSYTVAPNKYTGKYISEPLSIIGEDDTATDGDQFEVYAECSGEKTDVVSFIYLANAVTVEKAVETVNITKFIAPGKTNISHGGQANVFDITDVFTRGASPVVVLNPSEMLQFKFRLNNDENVSDVILMSNNDGNWQFMELYYDAQSDYWIGEGNFDVKDHVPVPGQYNLPGELHLFYYYGERLDTYQAHYYGKKSTVTPTSSDAKTPAPVGATEPPEDEDDEDEPFYYDKDGKPHGKLGDYNETIRDAAKDIFIDIVQGDVSGALSDTAVGGLKALWEWGNKDDNFFRATHHGYSIGPDGMIVFPEDHVGMVDPNSKQRNAIDPSGIVFEAVEGNRVEGATATIYKLNTATGEWEEWNASDFEQQNPLKTNNEGAYAWFTDEGRFKVTISKEGYETQTSEEFDIPPEKLGLNFSLVDNTTHPTATVEKDDETGAYMLRFSKFMQVDTVNTNTVKIEGLDNITITPVYLSDGDAYADTFAVDGTPNGDDVTFTLSESSLSYSGMSAIADTISYEESILGDVDSDGDVTIIDASMIQRHLADIQTFAYDESVADTDLDGSITIIDATYIQRWLASLKTNDKIGKSFS